MNEVQKKKIIKVRLKGLAAGNGVGEKHPMLVIGKAEKPQCFYRFSIGPRRNPTWTLKSFLIMYESMT